MIGSFGQHFLVTVLVLKRIENNLKLLDSKRNYPVQILLCLDEAKIHRHTSQQFVFNGSYFLYAQITRILTLVETQIDLRNYPVLKTYNHFSQRRQCVIVMLVLFGPRLAKLLQLFISFFSNMLLVILLQDKFEIFSQFILRALYRSQTMKIPVLVRLHRQQFCNFNIILR